MYKEFPLCSHPYSVFALRYIHGSHSDWCEAIKAFIHIFLTAQEFEKEIQSFIDHLYFFFQELSIDFIGPII